MRVTKHYTFIFVIMKNLFILYSKLLAHALLLSSQEFIDSVCWKTNHKSRVEVQTSTKNSFSTLFDVILKF